MRKHTECIKLCLVVDDEQVKSLWVRIKQQTSRDDTAVCVCYRPPKQETEVHEALYMQYKAVSEIQTLLLLGDFNYADICCRTITGKHEQPSRFLKSIDHSFLSWIVEDPTRNFSAA